jgi:hypothetical protein
LTTVALAAQYAKMKFASLPARLVAALLLTATPALAQLASLGGEFQVNTYTTYRQRFQHGRHGRSRELRRRVAQL